MNIIFLQIAQLIPNTFARFWKQKIKQSHIFHELIQMQHTLKTIRNRVFHESISLQAVLMLDGNALNMKWNDQVSQMKKHNSKLEIAFFINQDQLKQY